MEGYKVVIGGSPVPPLGKTLSTAVSLLSSCIPKHSFQKYVCIYVFRGESLWTCSKTLPGGNDILFSHGPAAGT